MSVVKIAENIYSVGVHDYDVRVFHGYETPHGTTYNSYLVIDDKVSLIDYVKAPFTKELIANVSSIIDPSRIDYLICNHIEPDHSGALPAMADLAPNAKVFCTPSAKLGLGLHYNREFNWQVVKSGDKLSTGHHTFTFVHMPMVHWPDSMSTYLAEEKILFSNDAFGQHIAAPCAFDDEVGLDVILERAGDYYANIVLPFGEPVKKLMASVHGLDIRLIAPSHGLFWRSYIPQIMKKYGEWSDNRTDENRAVVIYDTMWGATETMAKRLVQEFEREGKVVTPLNLRSNHISRCMATLLEAKTIAVGSPTLNRHMLPSVAAMMTYMQGLFPKNRTGLAFGSYGWSGESIRDIDRAFEDMGWERLPSRKVQYKKGLV